MYITCKQHEQIRTNNKNANIVFYGEYSAVSNSKKGKNMYDNSNVLQTIKM